MRRQIHIGADPIKIKKKRKKIYTASCRGAYVCDEQASDGRRLEEVMATCQSRVCAYVLRTSIYAACSGTGTSVRAELGAVLARTRDVVLGSSLMILSTERAIRRTASTLGWIFYSMHRTQQVAPLLSAFRARNNRKPPTETADQSQRDPITCSLHPNPKRINKFVLRIIVTQSGAHKFHWMFIKYINIYNV